MTPTTSVFVLTAATEMFTIIDATDITTVTPTTETITVTAVTTTSTISSTVTVTATAVPVCNQKHDMLKEGIIVEGASNITFVICQISAVHKRAEGLELLQQFEVEEVSCRLRLSSPATSDSHIDCYFLQTPQSQG